MVRRWRVTKGSQVHATATISKMGSQGFLSPNPKDFEKYRDIMTDEVEFRKLFTNNQGMLKHYEEFLESE